MQNVNAALKRCNLSKVVIFSILRPESRHTSPSNSTKIKTLFLWLKLPSNPKFPIQESTQSKYYQILGWKTKRTNIYMVLQPNPRNSLWFSKEKGRELSGEIRGKWKLL